jgi:Fuc2NAc and GlcNAc transferase
MIVTILLVGIVLLSLSITFWVRSYALKHLLDIPNQRSSHQQPTPRGGGLAIVVVFFLSILFCFFKDLLEFRFLCVFMVSLLIAVIGFWDDHQHIAARWRMTVHIGAALIAVLLLQSVSLMAGFSVFFLVWSLNLFNFMDGIDGIAGSEAVFVATALAGLMWFVNPDLAWLGAIVAASSLGFLLLNWPPAKIFMGDVGSGFLGFVLGLLILIYNQDTAIFLVVGLILFSVFITDATYTLLTRILTGEKWYQAHCTHAFQHAAKRYGHLRVLLAMWAINIFWILPVTVTVFLRSEYSFFGMIAVYIPLIFLAYKFNAGRQKPLQANLKY